MATVITAGNATNGLSLSADNTGSFDFKTGSGAGTSAMTISSSQVVSIPGNLTVVGTLTATGGVSGGIRSGTAVASTSGTSIDFTGIPAGVKRITILCRGVSTTGTIFGVQLGSGSFVTSGYSGSVSALGNTAAVSATTPTNLIGIAFYVAASSFSGSCVIANIDGNNWVAQSNGGWFAANVTSNGGGSVALSGTLDRLRITTVNGTDTFDAGSINILYE